MTTKIHYAVDGKGRPLAIVVTGGQRNDGAVLEQVLADIRVPRRGRGRPQTRPDAVLAGKAYAAGVTRKMLQGRGIKVVIPLKSDQIAARKRKGSKGGRPPALDIQMYRKRNVVERSFALIKQRRGLATRYDKLASPPARQWCCRPALSGPDYEETRPSRLSGSNASMV